MRPRRRTPLGIEPLERRDLMAGLESPVIELPFGDHVAGGNVTAEIIDGTLVVRGDAQDNDIIIEQWADGRFAIQGQRSTTVNGKCTDWPLPNELGKASSVAERGPLVVAGVTRGISIELGDGDDCVMLAGTSLPATDIRTGAGDDSVGFFHGLLIVSPHVILASYFPPAPAQIDGDLCIDTGSGDDLVSPFVEVRGNAEVQTGTGADRVVSFWDYSQGHTILRNLEATGAVAIDLGADDEDPGVPADWRDDAKLADRIEQPVRYAFEQLREGRSLGEWDVRPVSGRLPVEVWYDAGQSEMVDRLERRGITVVNRSDEYGRATAWINEAELAQFSGLPGIQYIGMPLVITRPIPESELVADPGSNSIPPDDDSVSIVEPSPVAAPEPSEQSGDFRHEAPLIVPVDEPAVVAGPIATAPVVAAPATDSVAVTAPPGEPIAGDSPEKAPLAAPRIEISLNITAPDGSVLHELRVGQDFLLNVDVDDLRLDGRGVFSAYMDVNWESTLANATGPIRYSPAYGSIQGGDSSQPGLLDEAGATGNLAPPGSAKLRMFSIPMRATAAGSLLIALTPSENPHRETTVHGDDDAVDASLVSFGDKAIRVSG